MPLTYDGHRAAYTAASEAVTDTLSRTKVSAADWARAAADLATAADRLQVHGPSVSALDTGGAARETAILYAQVSLALDAAERRAAQTEQVAAAQHQAEDAARPSWDALRKAWTTAAIPIYVLVALPPEGEGGVGAVEWDVYRDRLDVLWREWLEEAAPGDRFALYATRTARDWDAEQVTEWVDDRYLRDGADAPGTLVRSHTVPDA